MVIDFSLTLRRAWFDPTDNDYSLYKKSLQEKLQALKDTWPIRIALINEDLINKMRTALEDEIKYCEFHEEFFDRLDNESQFNEWVFNENIEFGYWEKTIGDEWTRTNGRIKATIQITPPKIDGKMTRIELKYKNDSNILTFSDRYEKENRPHNLKNLDSIKQRIKELKKEAENYLDSKLYPQWNIEKGNLVGLNKMLCITEDQE